MGIYPLNAVLNALVTFSIGLQPPKGAGLCDEVFACATEVRKSLEKLKDPSLIRDLATEFAHVQSRVAWDKIVRTNLNESTMRVNVTRRWVSGCLGMKHC